MHYDEVCYGDEELFEEIMNPIYRIRKQLGIVNSYQEYVEMVKQRKSNKKLDVLLEELLQD